MKLTRLKIKNFRCIDDLSIGVSNFTSIIGPNNTGKSSILRAIALLLNQEKPEVSEWRKGHENEEIEIEGTFEDLQEWERNTPGVSGLVCDGKITLRMKALCVDGQVSSAYEAFSQPTEITGWSEAWGDVSPELKAIAAQVGVNSAATWKTAANKSRVRERVRESQPDLIQMLDPQWSSDSISINAALKQALPLAVYVPAVKDASDESKPGAKTSFGLLLKKIVLPAIQSSDEYQELLTAVNRLSQKLRGTGGEQLEAIRLLGESLSQRMSSILAAEVKFRMDTPDTDKFVGANTGINIDDGTETPIHQQGHGVQRALVFAMIEFLASQDAAKGENQSRTTILLFEEPEIFLHPHLMQRLRRGLMELASQESWQVAITTHSPFFVNVADDPTSLLITSRTDAAAAPVHKQLAVDPFLDATGTVDERTALRAAMDFHPTVCEAFFANRAVLVEGDTEVAIFKHSASIHGKFGISDQSRDSVTIVSCGGKWTIPAIARIMGAFGLQFRVIHDMDRKGRTEDQLLNAVAIDPYKANQKIREAAGTAPVHVVEDTVEHLLWPGETDASRSDKPFQAWLRVRELANEDDLAARFPKLKELFEFAYSD